MWQVTQSLPRKTDLWLKKSKTGNTDLQSLTNKRTGEFLVPNTLRKIFGGLYTMKTVLSLDEAPPLLERSISAASKLKGELPTDLQMERIQLKELSSLVTDIHIKTREATQNTDLS